MAGVELGVLLGAGVGGEAGVAPAVAVLDQVQLRAGVGPFAAHDDAHAGRVVGEHRCRQGAGRLGDRGRVTLVPSMSTASVQACVGSAAMAVCSRSVTAQPMEMLWRTSRSRNVLMWARNALDAPAPSVRTRIG